MGSKRFPLFVDLTGRAAVVIGGGKVGLRRAEVLRRFGADVTLISPRLCAPLEGVRHIPGPTSRAIWPGPSWPSPPRTAGRSTPPLAKRPGSGA